jgi:hypothetical protein
MELNAAEEEVLAAKLEKFNIIGAGINLRKDDDLKTQTKIEALHPLSPLRPEF